MPATLQQLTEALLDAALRAGAEAADALAMDGASIGIDLRAGALEKAERAEGTDIGLRVLIAGRQACVSASDTSPATILAIAERAVAMARSTRRPLCWLGFRRTNYAGLGSGRIGSD